MNEYTCSPAATEIRSVRPKVGKTDDGKPFDHSVEKQIAKGA